MSRRRSSAGISIGCFPVPGTDGLRCPELTLSGPNDRASAANAPSCRPLSGRTLTRLRRLQALGRLRLAYQWIPLRMGQRFDCQIDIELWPVQMVRARQLNSSDLVNRGVLNHGNSLKDTNNSCSSMKSQNPCGETFVTSSGEVLRPSDPDFIQVLPNQFLGFCNLFRLEAVVRVQFHRRVDPKLGLAVSMLDMYVRPRFLTREEVESKSSNAPVAPLTRARRGNRYWSGYCCDPPSCAAGRFSIPLLRHRQVAVGQSAPTGHAPIRSRSSPCEASRFRTLQMMNASTHCTCTRDNDSDRPRRARLPLDESSSFKPLHHVIHRR